MKPILITLPKPRAKHLNEVLLSRPAGKMKDKSVETRQQQKLATKKQITDD